MKVKELRRYLEGMNDDGAVEISMPVEGESTWWDFEFGADSDSWHALIVPKGIVMG